MNYKAFSIISLIFLISLGSSQNYTSFPIGQFWLFPDARSLAMGGAGSVSLNTPAAIQYNPASLTQTEQDLSLQLTVNSHKLEERRSFPVYDRFDGVFTSGIYAINNNWYLYPQGAVSFRLPLSTMPNIIIALGSFLEIDQNYRYDEEVRDNIFGDPLIAYNNIEYDGVLRRYSIAVASEIPSLPALSFGFQAGILNGSLDYFEETDFTNSNTTDLLEEYRRSLDNTPFLFSFGAILRINKRISTGFDLSLPYKVTYQSTKEQNQTVNEEIGYPLRLNSGFEFRAQQALQARLNIDFGYEFWSSETFKSEINSIVPTKQKFSDVYALKIGLEQIFFNKVPFRAGIQYRNNYAEKGRTQTFITAGTGFRGDNWMVDVGGAFSKLDYRAYDLFDDRLFRSDPSFQGRVDKDDVEENYFIGRITLTYNFDISKAE